MLTNAKYMKYLMTYEYLYEIPFICACAQDETFFFHDLIVNSLVQSIKKPSQIS